MHNNNYDCDVLIIGASMAGSCLARQLVLKHPELRITVIDRKTGFDHWVGESMLEIFWDYAVKDLKLGPYLDTNHLYKHGLRFYFDNPDKSLSIPEMSEIGRAWYHGVPAHQIDRKRFDEDLCRMNQEAGVDVHLGCGATSLEIDGERGHVVQTSQGEIRCRWLVDAAGFRSPVCRQLRLVKRLENHPISSCWMRVSHTNHLDHLGDEAWRSRSNYTSRFLATNHFMYEGYWFWVIPIDEHTSSIGLVWRHDLADLNVRSAPDFIRFLSKHRGLAEWLGDHFETKDFYVMKNLARMAEQFYSKDRWFLTGMSAAFVDPLLSSGSAFLADSNRRIGDLIAEDLGGNQDRFEQKAVCYNAHAKWWIENFMLHVTGNYNGSYDVHKILFNALLMDYFGIVFPMSVAQYNSYDPAMDYGDGSEITAKLQSMVETSAIKRIHKLKAELTTFLELRGELYQNNKGNFHDVELAPKYMHHSMTRGRDLTLDAVDMVQQWMLRETIQRSLERMLQSLGQSVDAINLTAVVEAARKQQLSLAEALNLLQVSTNHPPTQSAVGMMP